MLLMLFNTISICLDDILYIKLNVKDGRAQGKCKPQRTITDHKQLGNYVKNMV